ncbi:BspA family leucine-rich repeat surface protein [Chryseobacterium koreense]
MRRTLLFSFLFMTMVWINAQIITKWNTNANNDNSREITIPTVGDYTYTYVKADNASVKGSGSGTTGNKVITFPSAGEYLVTITPSETNSFKFTFWSLTDDQTNKLTEIQKWGAKTWNPDLYGMFSGCSNLKITATDVPDFSNVTNMGSMFSRCGSLSNIPNANSWNTASVTKMSFMFYLAHNFNENIGGWNTSKVINMTSMFNGANAFKQSIGNWDTANVTDMSFMFYGASSFNKAIGTWNTANVTNMSGMFYAAASFNQNIGVWNTTNVTDMNSMFGNAFAFNQNIGNWDTTNVTDMSSMFYFASAFNQNIGSWNTANVTDMSNMFFNTSAFNQDIGNWNTAKVKNMYGMFGGAKAFNQNIGNWDTTNVTDMRSMFDFASAFNQNISSWNLKSNVILTSMLSNSGLDCENYSKTLKGWAENANTPTNRFFGPVVGLKYGPQGKIYRDILTKSVAQGGKGWTISGGDSYDSSCTGTLSVTDPGEKNVKLYPNPVKDKLYFSEEVSDIKITDLTGRTVKGIASSIKTVDVTHLAKGVYLISATTKEGKLITKKIVKE